MLAVTDFYDYAPQVHLPRPIVVTGYLTELSRSVAYRTAALLGLPFHDIDRWVEHDVGQSIRRLVFLEGESAYRQIEARCLSRALDQTPCGIIALGDGGLLEEASRDRVAQQGSLVILDVDLPNLYWQVQRAARSTEINDWHPLFEGTPAHMDDLRPFFLERRKGFGNADLRIDAIRASGNHASRRLMSWIESSQA